MSLASDLTPLDRHLADFLCRLAGAGGGDLWPVAALLSRAVGEGHVCLDLAELAGRDELPGERTLAEWLEYLAGLPVVGRPGAFAPLVLDGVGRLYLHRLWQDEQDVAAALRARATAIPEDEVRDFRADLTRLFPASVPGELDGQAVAALAALRQRFCMISGGPGTGKTTTVVKILALLLEQAQGRLAVALAAPTGKAAARLKEAIRGARERIPVAEEIRELIPDEVATLHRLLGIVPGRSTPRHHPGNPLPADLVVVDEASMVPLPLMARLVRALRPGARLVLLGDRDQLASVEAGAVLGDLCDPDQADRFTPAFRRFVARHGGMELPSPPGEVAPLADGLVVLRRSYRFGEGSGIGRVSRLVNAGAGEGALAALRDGGHPDLAWRALPAPEELPAALAGVVRDGYGPCLAAADPAEALARFDRFRILCALRAGPVGTAGLNRTCERLLAEAGLIDPRAPWYPGRPVMVTVNDYGLGLFNGDIGICRPDPATGGSLQVFFPAADGGVRAVPPLRLPEHETAYALTVHKSQGSEFDRVLLVLPGSDSPLLTRELVYTGLTRARQAAYVWGTEELFLIAMARRIQRRSGLRAALWGEDDNPAK